MALNEANALMERMKSDYSFRTSILNSNSIEDRLTKCKEEGFDVTKKDFLVLSNSNSNDKSETLDNLANTWSSGGPCHRKCAPIVVE